MYFSFRFIYLIYALAFISTDTMFAELGFKTYKFVIILSIPLSFLFFKQYSNYMRNWYLILLVYLFVSVLESYYLYSSFIRYSHVFNKVFVYFVIFFSYAFYKRFDKISVFEMILIYLAGFALNAVLVNSSSFSMGAFLRNHRGLSSESVYGMILALVYFFNKYFASRNVLYLMGFFMAAGLIFFLQHRTVWLCSGFGLILNFFLLPKSEAKIDVPALIPVAISVAIIATTLGVFIISNEKVGEKIQKSIDDITNPTGNAKDDEFSTSEWRYMQFQSYWPYIEDNFMTGMRLKGYELPIQFYDPNGLLVWEDGTGHHFHSFYVDRLFYQGVVGILLFLLPIFIYIFILAVKVKKFTVEQLSLLSFVSTGLLYGISWNWPIYYFGFVGYCLMKLEQGLPKKKEENSEENITEDSLEHQIVEN